MAETTIGFEPPVVVLDGAIEQPLTDLASYRAVGGYAQLERARAMTPHDVTDQLIQSNLRGRGGASSRRAARRASSRRRTRSRNRST
jgi:NADH:ubiquinone oxidoreductase, NADH-binding (51 kD) subunit